MEQTEQEFEGMSKLQAAKFRAFYENEYLAMFPLPSLKIVGLDWKFWASIVVSVATVILAALRTAQMFFFAAETSARSWGLGAGGMPLMSFGDSLASLIAVEGGLAVIAALKTVEKDEVPQWVYNVQIGLLLFISVIAGIGQSLGLIPDIDPDALKTFSYFLVGTLGIGASFAAWLSGEVLGIQVKKYTHLRKSAEEDLQNDLSIHLSKARKKFLELSGKLQESSKKVPEDVESSMESSKKVPDWRKQNFTKEQKEDMARWTPDQMRSYAMETGYTYKTLSNWRNRSRVELGIDTESTDA